MLLKSVKPFVAPLLTRTSGTPRPDADGSAITAQMALRTGRRLTRRSTL
jgi:hypothetical protein